ncbi:hypothetical protein E4U52_005361 [Claviceps spartinae]|nr:hypothetical protein E4U52_005361 [Claviceps spartinae]KAG6083304.1 hypothetical protein E4U15_002043 [Claviceps sp. LM218 group G6]KAG6098439.1 hypothetical protein E4U30_007978 [Claviceps sp. LM220 group G6]KAG6110646.1 hypothetical protein E4U31_005487 [Claviceps sp. LM219 group G6]KAG6111322.1 hypothetical protein E4U14_002499 [Claviceps sp. LM454 group G7]
MPVITLTSKDEFDSLIKSNPFVAIQASASWCGPCKAISPLFVKHSDEHGVENTFAFAKFDTDDVPALAMELGVRSLPTFLFFENGDKSDVTVTGANPQALKNSVEKLAEKTKANGASTLKTNEDF